MRIPEIERQNRDHCGTHDMGGFHHVEPVRESTNNLHTPRSGIETNASRKIRWPQLKSLVMPACDAASLVFFRRRCISCGNP